jgi:TolB protein
MRLACDGSHYDLEGTSNMHADSWAGRATRTLALTAVLIALLVGASTAQDRSAWARSTVSANSVSANSGLTGTIVFREFFDSGHNTGAIFEIGADGTGERQLSHPPAGAVDSLNGPPGHTPNGSMFVFDRTDRHGNGSLWSIRADGSSEHKIHSLPGMPGDGWPTVSPTGHQIAVARSWGKKDSYQDLKTGLYILNSDGSAPRLVAPLGYTADVGGATWSPDGHNLVFSVLNNGPGTPSGGSALFMVSTSGQDLHRITNWDTTGQIASPTFSPNGKLLLFRITPQGQDFGGNYYTIHPNGTNRHKLTHFSRGSNLGSAAWSPNGKWIVFANTGVGGNDDLFVMHSNGTHISQLTRTKVWESAPTWVR